MRRRFRLSTFAIYLFLFEISLVFGTAVNRSIDDTLGDSVTGLRPTYLPSTTGVWEDNTCSGCALAPSIDEAFDKTYTAATYNPDLENISISFDFVGTAIYIFFILSNDDDTYVSASTKTNFTLDGKLAGAFSHSPNTSASAPAFYFNESALGFSKTGMANTSHQMVISTSGLSSDYYLCFDYALYTFDAGTTTVSTSSKSMSSTASSTSSTSTSSTLPSSSSTPVGAVVGGVVGGLAALAALIAALFFCYRRRRIDNSPSDEDPNSVFHREIDPFILPGPGPTLEPSFIDAASRPGSTHPNFFSSSVRSMITSTIPSTPGFGYGVGAAAASMLTPLTMATDSKSALRRQRHQEIERQMQQLNQEILDLQTEAAERNFNLGAASTLDLNSNTDANANSLDYSQLQSGSRRRSSIGSPNGSEGPEDVSRLRAQIQAMSEQIAFLQDQRDNSEWAQGISDEPPPGYSPAGHLPV